MKLATAILKREQINQELGEVTRKVSRKFHLMDHTQVSRTPLPTEVGEKQLETVSIVRMTVPPDSFVIRANRLSEKLRKLDMQIQKTNFMQSVTIPSSCLITYEDFMSGKDKTDVDLEELIENGAVETITIAGLLSRRKILLDVETEYVKDVDLLQTVTEQMTIGAGSAALEEKIKPSTMDKLTEKWRYDSLVLTFISVALQKANWETELDIS